MARLIASALQYLFTGATTTLAQQPKKAFDKKSWFLKRLHLALRGPFEESYGLRRAEV